MRLYLNGCSAEFCVCAVESLGSPLAYFCLETFEVSRHMALFGAAAALGTLHTFFTFKETRIRLSMLGRTREDCNHIARKEQTLKISQNEMVGFVCVWCWKNESSSNRDISEGGPETVVMSLPPPHEGQNSPDSARIAHNTQLVKLQSTSTYSTHYITVTITVH